MRPINDPALNGQRRDFERQFMDLDRKYVDRETGWPITPPPYSWEQIKEVAKLVTEIFDRLVDGTQEIADSVEAESTLERIRVAQGVEYVMEHFRLLFRTNNYSYAHASDEAAETFVYYILEDL